MWCVCTIKRLIQNQFMIRFRWMNPTFIRVIAHRQGCRLVSSYRTFLSCLVCSQSTDSEPVYDQPNLYQSRYSDSEHDRASSASPPASDDIYSEVQPDDNTTDEHLVRPSFVRTRRDLYKGKHCSRLILYLYLRKYAGITLSSCLLFHLCIARVSVCLDFVWKMSSKSQNVANQTLHYGSFSSWVDR